MSVTARIYVWRFPDAPEEYRRLSTGGGDGGWLVFVPSYVANETWITPLWIEVMDSCRDPQRIKLENGDIVYIGAHA